MFRPLRHLRRRPNPTHHLPLRPDSPRFHFHQLFIRLIHRPHRILHHRLHLINPLYRMLLLTIQASSLPSRRNRQSSHLTSHPLRLHPRLILPDSLLFQMFQLPHHRSNRLYLLTRHRPHLIHLRYQMLHRQLQRMNHLVQALRL
jgi:hypothetical protein